MPLRFVCSQLLFVGLKLPLTLHHSLLSLPYLVGLRPLIGDRIGLNGIVYLAKRHMVIHFNPLSLLSSVPPHSFQFLFGDSLLTALY